MWQNPLILFGNLSIPFLVSNFLVVLGFVLSAWFAWGYTRKFYEGREKPLSWLLIVLGLSIMILSETGQFLSPYRVGITTLQATAILITQNIAVVMIAAGCYLLYREVGS